MKIGADIYDFLAPKYGALRDSRKAYIAGVNKRCTPVLTNCSTWLDIGSGDGARVRDISSEVDVPTIVCIEPSRAMADLCSIAVTSGKVLNRYFDEAFVNGSPKYFECVTALWNVLGHIPSVGGRREFVHNASQVLTSGGTFLFDVNNRHNGRAYGAIRSRLRFLRDKISFDEARGDAVYPVVVGKKSELCKGHLFTYEEVVGLFDPKDWASVEVQYVDYQSGEQVNSRFWGQISVRAVAS